MFWLPVVLAERKPYHEIRSNDESKIRVFVSGSLPVRLFPTRKATALLRWPTAPEVFTSPILIIPHPLLPQGPKGPHPGHYLSQVTFLVVPLLLHLCKFLCT